MKIDKILEARGNEYGDFAAHASITQNIKKIMKSTKSWGSLSPDKKEALEMIAHKIARILNGNPEYKDSWSDIVGYAKLIDDTLTIGKSNEEG